MESFYHILPQVMQPDVKAEMLFNLNPEKFIRILNRPEGKEGIVAARHAGIRLRHLAWGFSRVHLDFNANTLEIGHGAGYLVEALARTIKTLNATGKMFGVDVSQTMIQEASQRNEELISQGIVDLQQANVSSLPFKADFFSTIITVVSINYWEVVIQGFREAYRVLQPGGTFIILENAFKDRMDTTSIEKLKLVNSWNLYSKKALESYLREAGFNSVKVKEKRMEKLSFLKLMAIK